MVKDTAIHLNCYIALLIFFKLYQLMGIMLTTNIYWQKSELKKVNSELTSHAPDHCQDMVH